MNFDKIVARSGVAFTLFVLQVTTFFMQGYCAPPFGFCTGLHQLMKAEKNHWWLTNVPAANLSFNTR